ncbi:prefoldin subunit alpha [Candidatus Woesearchaeota archaeon]|nr:prefoldin subunit alpha [Candidatus Woesearchaeota archaeon]
MTDKKKAEGPSVEKQQQLQQKYMEFQMLQQQMKQISENMQQVTERIAEVSKVIENVKQLGEVSEGNEILVPISNGIFIKAKSGKTTDFLVNVGSKSVVQKDQKGVIELLEKQKVELIELQNDMTRDLGELEDNGMRLQDELQAIMR